VSVSPYSVGLGALGVNASHYNLLTTIEWLLGLPSTGTGNDGTSQFPALTGLFHFPAAALKIGPPQIDEYATVGTIGGGPGSASAPSISAGTAPVARENGPNGRRRAAAGGRGGEGHRPPPDGSAP
jgi:hypothetical protein